MRAALTLVGSWIHGARRATLPALLVLSFASTVAITPRDCCGLGPWTQALPCCCPADDAAGATPSALPDCCPRAERGTETPSPFVTRAVVPPQPAPLALVVPLATKTPAPPLVAAVRLASRGLHPPGGPPLLLQKQSFLI